MKRGAQLQTRHSSPAEPPATRPGNGPWSSLHSRIWLRCFPESPGTDSKADSHQRCPRTVCPSVLPEPSQHGCEKDD